MNVRYEYRAIFSSPFGEPDTYSAAVTNPAHLPKSEPRSEETLRYVSGIQTRTVSDWHRVPDANREVDS